MALRAYFIDVWGPCATDREVLALKDRAVQDTAIVFAQNRRDANDLGYFYASFRDCRERGLKRMEYGSVCLNIAEYDRPEGLVIVELQGYMGLSDERMEEVRGLTQLSKRLTTKRVPRRGFNLYSVQIERSDSVTAQEGMTLFQPLCFVPSEELANAAVMEAAGTLGEYDSSAEVRAVSVEQIPGTVIAWNPTYQCVQLGPEKTGVLDV